MIYCQTLPLPHGQIWSRTLCGVRQILELIAEGNRIKARVLLLAPALHWSGYQWEDSGCFFTLYRGPSIPPLESSCKIIRGETVRFNVEAPRIKTDAASIHCSLGLLCIQKRLHRAALFFSLTVPCLPRLTRAVIVGQPFTLPHPRQPQADLVLFGCGSIVQSVSLHGAHTA